MSDILFKMTSPEGITLNTEATYVDKNIAVAPELEDVSITPTKETQTRTPAEGKAGIGIVTVNPIPDDYIQPSGTLELTNNNIDTAFPIDCSKYANVTVNTAEPLKITDPTVLDNITDTPHGVGGNVFLYEGATTDTYENGAYYLLEDMIK